MKIPRIPKCFKVPLIILVSSILLVILLQILISTPFVQNKIKHKVAETLHNTLNAEVTIGAFQWGFPRTLNVSDVLILKSNSDSLFSLKQLSVTVRLLPLFRKQVVLQNIDLVGVDSDIDKLIAEFATDTTSINETPYENNISTNWTINAEELSVKSSYIGYLDTDIGMDLKVNVGELNLSLGTLNMDSFITIESVIIVDSEVSYASLFVENPDTSTSSFAKILLENARLENSSFTYVDEDSALFFETGGKQLKMNNFLLDLNKESVAFNTGEIQKMDVVLKFKSDTLDADSINASDLNWGASLWRVTGNELILDDFRYAMDYVDEPKIVGYFDSQHMKLDQIKGKLTNFIIDEDTLIAEIHHLSGTEENGFQVKEMSAVLNQKGELFSIKKMSMQTAVASYFMEMTTTISPTNYNNLARKIVDVKLEVSSVNWADVDYFYPLLEKFDVLSPEFLQSSYSLQTKITGVLDQFQVHELIFSTLKSTKANVGGSIHNVLSDSAMRLDITIEEISTTKNDIEIGFIDISTQFGEFALPNNVSLAGNYSMNADQHFFEGNIHTSVGSIEVPKLQLTFGETPEYRIQMNAHLNQLSQINTIDLDKAVFSLNADYTGADLYSGFGNVNVKMDSLVYAHSLYSQAEFEGNINYGDYQIGLVSLDSAVHLTASAKGFLSETSKKINFEAHIENLDLGRIIPDLDSLSVGTDLALNIALEGSESAIVDLNLQRVDFLFSDSSYSMQPAVAHFETNESSTELSAKSAFYTVDFSAAAYINNVFAAFTSLPNYYLNQEKDSAVFDLPAFTLKGEIIYPEELAYYLPFKIPLFENLTINGEHNIEDDQFYMRVNASKLNYNSIHFKGVKVDVSGSSKNMELLALSDLEFGEVLKGDFQTTAKFDRSTLLSNIKYSDSFGNNYLNLTTRVDTINGNYKLEIIPDSMLFNYEKWSMPENNKIIFGNAGLYAENVQLNNGDEQISFCADRDVSLDNMIFELQKFNIGKTEQLFALDTFVTGVIDAKIEVISNRDEPNVNGEIQINNTNIHGIDIGKINLSHFQYSDSLFALNMDVDGNAGAIRSHVELNNFKKIDAAIDIQKLELAELNYLLADYIKDARGLLQGTLKLHGEVERPILNGNVQFKDAGMEVRVLDEYYHFGNDTIFVEDNVLHFPNFSIQNERKKKAKLKGKVALVYGKQAYTDLLFSTENMEWMNSTQKDSEIIFGTLKAQTEISIKGTSTKNKIKAKVAVDKTTDITYVFPDNLIINDDKGIVTFNTYREDTVALPDVKKHNVFFGLGNFTDIESSLEIDKGAQFKLFFDDGGENYLDASLNGVMNYNVKGKNNEISGVFTIDKGNLHYSIPMVTVDNFNIEPGSSLTLSNDIYNPYLNIVASSNIRASTEGLMDDYSKVMTFKVLLYMHGDLNNLKLRFDIAQKTDDAMVSAKLSQLTEIERNMNALNLLVRGTFGFSLQGSGSGTNSTAQAQLDKFYANQLNNLISDNVKFVDLHFDVQSFEDYGAAGSQVYHRNFYYELGKSFWNDRARVNYKGSIGFVEDEQSESINSSFVQNQLEVEFRIVKDGSLNGLFFRKDQYEGLLEGQVIETGVGIRISKEYYSIKDIFVNEDNKRAKTMRDKKLDSEK